MKTKIDNFCEKFDWKYQTNSLSLKGDFLQSKVDLEKSLKWSKISVEDWFFIENCLLRQRAPSVGER